MISVLSLAGSSYLEPFLQLKELIQQEAMAAEDNVKFLAGLEQPCQQLSNAGPLEIPSLLPEILDGIRMIWSSSQHYNTPERICGLLRKLSNEVINRCCAVLQLEDIFTGDVSKPMEQLQQSIAAGVSGLTTSAPADQVQRKSGCKAFTAYSRCLTKRAVFAVQVWHGSSVMKELLQLWLNSFHGTGTSMSVPCTPTWMLSCSAAETCWMFARHSFSLHPKPAYQYLEAPEEERLRKTSMTYRLPSKPC